MNKDYQYCIGKEKDIEDILDFANMVFSMSYKSVDFAGFLPKAYANERNEIPIHHMIKECGKIKAVIDVYPFQMKQYKNDVTDCQLKAGYIGTVAVHPKSRGKGYMITLMDQVQKQAQEDDYDIILLDGNRHRYQYYGFERAGIKYNFNVNNDSIRHCCSRLYEQYQEPVYSFEHVTCDSKYLDEMYQLYSKRNVVAREAQDFYLCLQSNYSKAYAILKNGEFAGYINVSDGETNIHEFELRDLSVLPKVIYDFFEEFCVDEIGVNVGADETGKIEYLDHMSDYFSTSASRQIKILNYVKVLEFLLKWKRKYAKLSDGKYVIGIKKVSGISEKDEEIEKIAIEILDGVLNVYRTDNQTADVVLEELELVKRLTTNFYWHEISRTSGYLSNAPKGWFPLPFFLPDADSF